LPYSHVLISSDTNLQLIASPTNIHSFPFLQLCALWVMAGLDGEA